MLEARPAEKFFLEARLAGTWAVEVKGSAMSVALSKKAVRRVVIIGHVIEFRRGVKRGCRGQENSHSADAFPRISEFLSLPQAHTRIAV